jgi:nickel-dependent lactate racemase
MKGNHHLTLPWGKDTLELSLPEEWTMAGAFKPAALPGAPNVADEVRRSLQSPIETSRLRDLARDAGRVVIVIDDLSRPTPVSQILPGVLEELAQGGVGREDVTVAVALGLHRPMTGTEVAERTGSIDLSGLTWENHDCDAADSLVNLGTTQRGTPVQVQDTVAQAGLVVSIGCIEPHIIASFGGGYKNLVPGMAGRETIAHNHSLNCTPATFNMVGQPIERNPMRLVLEEAAGMIEGQVFLVNAVLNGDLDVVRVVSGDPVAAHRAGAETSAEIYGVQIPAAADVVITDSHPMDQDLRQGVKALANTVRAVRKGGVLITLARAEEGVGVFGLAERKLPVGQRALKLLAPLLLRLVPRLNMEGEEDRFFLYFALQAMCHCDLLIYGPTIPEEARTGLPFVTFVDSPQEAVERATRLTGNSAQVLAFPHGGITYPILP